MKRLQVRCCCQPTKILGTLEVPYAPESGHGFFYLWDIAGKKHRVRVENLYDYTDLSEEIYTLAIYSEDRSVEFWRQFLGFKEETANG